MRSASVARVPSYEDLFHANTELHERVTTLNGENAHLKEQLERVYHQLRELKRHVFGRRSEKLAVVDAKQGVLFDFPRAGI